MYIFTEIMQLNFHLKLFQKTFFLGNNEYSRLSVGNSVEFCRILTIYFILSRRINQF